MTIVRARRRETLVIFAFAAVLAACGTRESPPPPISTPEARASVAPTTTTTTTTTMPSPPPVWRSAHWGMTKDELLAAFPGEAQRLPQPADFGRPASGSSDVAIAVYEVDGNRFRVLFGFESDALNRIQLSAPKAGETACGDLEKLVTGTHAAPSDRSSTQTTVRTEHIVWKRPDQTITLTCAEAPGLGYRSVTLDYTTPDKS